MIVNADARRLPLRDASVQCCVTSPPYWGLRDYGVAGQFGLEATPAEYVEHMVEVFREVRRVLRDDGTLWLNLGDSYNAGRDGGHPGGAKSGFQQVDERYLSRSGANVSGLKPKDLIGIPWRVAFALQADGWWLRSDIVWSKPNPMPESVTDRPTRAHEYVFLLAKSERYYFDAAAIREPALVGDHPRTVDSIYEAPGQTRHNGIRRAGLEMGARARDKQRGHSRRHDGFNDRWDQMTKAEQQEKGRNKRDVWAIATQPYPGAHFATMPEALAEPCILAGCPVDGTVLDPFAGTGTVGRVAVRHNRRAVLCDLSLKYLRECAALRTVGVQRELRKVMP